MLLICNSTVEFWIILFLFVYWCAVWLESLDPLSPFTSRTTWKGRFGGFNRRFLRLFALACCSCPKNHRYKEGKNPCRNCIHEHFFGHNLAWITVEDKVFPCWNADEHPPSYGSQLGNAPRYSNIIYPSHCLTGSWNESIGIACVPESYQNGS